MMLSVRATLVMAAAFGLSIALLWFFHDRTWWPPDEGVYAYVAQRLLAGDALHRDLIDLHGGYVNLLHALALRVFGEDLLSLRYPLVLLTVVQSLLAASLLRPKGLAAAAIAAIGATSFSFIQFLNPSANWYALFIFFAACWTLTRVNPTRPSGAVLIGVLLGLGFLFRQLSGVFLAMGVLTWLLVNLPEGRGTPWLARGLLAIMAVGLAGYLMSKHNIVAWLVFGVWPMALLLIALWRARAGDGDVAKLVLGLGAGVLLAAAPLAVHHLFEGTFAAWLQDVLFTALVIHGQDFIGRSSFVVLLIGALIGLGQWSDPTVFLNGFLWLALLSAPLFLGIILLRNALRRGEEAFAHPLPIMASFFALVAVHYQIPIYLWFGIAPVLLALLWFGSDRHPRLTDGLLLSLAAIALLFQAGQPLSRGLAGIIKGERVALDAPEGLPRASLKMERSDQRLFTALLRRIESEARPGEALFTLPMDPELNFLTGRRAPVPYYATPLGLRSKADVVDTLERLSGAAPLFVVYRREDKYLTPLTQDLLREIRRRDSVPEVFGPFELYRLPGLAGPGALQPPPG